MNYLVDAHTLVWALDSPDKLSKNAVLVLENSDNNLLISAGTMWELSIKVSLKKLNLSMPFRIWMEKGFTDLGLTLMPINLAHSDKQVGLDFHHKDPFDRILVAQALTEGISIISIDSIFDQYGVTRIW